MLNAEEENITTFVFMYSKDVYRDRPYNIRGSVPVLLSKRHGEGKPRHNYWLARKKKKTGRVVETQSIYRFIFFFSVYQNDSRLNCME